MDKGQELLKQAFSDLAKDMDSPETQARVTAFFETAAKFHRYSLGNQILIAIQRPDATQVAGFQAWKRLGRSVKAGEKGISILAPQPYDKEVEDETTGKKKRVSGVYFKSVAVFDISQTDGKPIENSTIWSKIDGNYDQFEPILEKFCQSQGITVKTVQMGDTLGLSAGGTILLKSGLESGRRILVWVHEIAHELMHKGKDRATMTKAQKELDADAVAYIVGRHMGIVSLDSAAYVKHWGATSDMLKERMDSISKTSRTIIDVLEGANAHS